MRSGRVLDGRSQVADHRIARILGAPVGVLLRRWGLPSLDGVAESRRLERHLPVVHPLDDVRAPLFRRRGIHVVDDGLDGVDQLSARPRLRVGGFEPPPGDEALLLGALLVQPVVGAGHGEEADPLVPQARPHGLVGEEQHGVVHLEREGVRLGVGRSLGGLVGDHPAHLDVVREAAHRLDEGPVAIQAANFVLLPPLRTNAEERHVALEQVVHLNDDRRRVLGQGLDVEDVDDRLEVGVQHRLIDGALRVGVVLVAHLAQQHLVAPPLPAHHRGSLLGAAPAHVLRGAGDPRHHQHLAPELLDGDLVEEVRIDPVDGEQAVVADGLVGDHLGVRRHGVIVPIRSRGRGGGPGIRAPGGAGGQGQGPEEQGYQAKKGHRTKRRVKAWHGILRQQIRRGGGL